MLTMICIFLAYLLVCLFLKLSEVRISLDGFMANGVILFLVSSMVILLISAANTTKIQSGTYELLPVNGQYISQNNLTSTGQGSYQYTFQQDDTIVTYSSSKITIIDGKSFVAVYDTTTDLGKWGFQFINLHKHSPTLFINKSDLGTLAVKPVEVELPIKESP